MRKVIVCICCINILLSCNFGQLESCIYVNERLPKIIDLQSYLNRLDGVDSVGKVCIKSTFNTKDGREFQQVIEVYIEEEIPFEPKGMPKNSFPSEFGFDLRGKDFEDMVSWKDQFRWDSLRGIAIILDSVYYEGHREDLLSFLSSLVRESDYIMNIYRGDLSTDWIWIHLFIDMKTLK